MWNIESISGELSAKYAVFGAAIYRSSPSSLANSFATRNLIIRALIY